MAVIWFFEVPCCVCFTTARIRMAPKKGLKRPAASMEMETRRAKKKPSAKDDEPDPLAGHHSETDGQIWSGCVPQCDEVEDGPESLHDILNWAERAVDIVLKKPHESDLFLANMSRGICIRTSYSGMKTPEIALDQLLAAANQLLPWFGKQPLGPKLHCAWSCDNGSGPLEVARGWSSERWAGKGHIFGDLHDLLSESALAEFHKFRKFQEQGRVEEGLGQLSNWLMKNCNEAIDTGRCYAHSARCRRALCCNLQE